MKFGQGTQQNRYDMQSAINRRQLESIFYIGLLLAFSGNPAFSIGTAVGNIGFPLVTVILFLTNIDLFFRKNSLYFYFYILFFFGVFLFQKLVLGFISYPGAIAFGLKIAFAYVVIRHFSTQFPRVYFQAMYVIAIISLIGFTVNLAGIDFPRIAPTGEKIRSVFLFTQNGDGARNSGMFWEPGAFAGYINLAFLFYLGNIRSLIKGDPGKFIVLLIALITTFSTTGYVVFFLIMVATLLFEYSRTLNVLIIPMLLGVIAGAAVVYQASPFLKDKMEHQLSAAMALQGAFANSRFGAFAFDMHYIKKHPWFGNGLHRKTRYADHPWLHNERLGHGNGFSNFLASMGILSFGFYALLLLRYNKNHPWVFLIGVVALLQGEQLMNYPLFLALPLVFLYGKESRRTANLPQSQG